MKRRTVLKLGAGLGALSAAGLAGKRVLLPPRPSLDPGPSNELAARFLGGLEPELRARVQVPWDDPRRQVHNRGSWLGNLRIWRRFERREQQLLVDLFHAGLSPAGRKRVPRQQFLRWPGINLLDVLVCGDPGAPPYQVVFGGPHLNLRVGGASEEGVAFGGPQVYGDQRGNGKIGMPGNLYRDQFEAAAELFIALPRSQREAAASDHEPIQTRLELRGAGAELPGIPVGELAGEHQRQAGKLVASMLAPWPRADVEYARACIEQNGGLGALHLSHYVHGEAGRSGAYQIFRLEGPAAVLHFRGHPHLHAFVHIARDAGAPLSVGEPLGHNPTPLEGAALARFFEDALRASAGSEVAWYPREGAVGLLRAGLLRSGDVYTAESWNDVVTVVEARGDALPAACVRDLARAGLEVDPARFYTLATTSHAASEIPGVRRRGAPLREAAVDLAREHGFRRPS